MSKNVYFGNLSLETTEEEMRNLVSEFGQIELIKLIIDRQTGQRLDFGFVKFDDEDDSIQCIKKLDGTEFKGQKLDVKEAIDHERRPPRKTKY